MGWSSGTKLMEALIDAFELIEANVPNKQGLEFWIEVIKAFEAQDWDCQYECIGSSPLWDQALFKHDPYAHGYFQEQDINPYPPGTKQHDLFQAGRTDLLAEQAD